MSNDLAHVVLYAVVFLVLFVIGGLLGAAMLPLPAGIGFRVGGIAVGAFGTGAGTLVLRKSL